MKLKVGERAPDFKVPTQGEDLFQLSDYQGKNVIVYFYPKDDTLGCTKQACLFRDHTAEFTDKNTVIIGISRDSRRSHQKFSEKYTLPFPLGSDEEGTITTDYGVWGEKSMYGKKYMGIERTTFLIGREGKIRAIWPKVKVETHIDEILKYLEVHA